MNQKNSRSIATWLLIVAALIFVMVVIGGVTRLTRSGLSIVEWQPIMGAIPPLNETRWDEVFDKYKATPEYQRVNSDMSVDEFKEIFYVEWFHRLLGRVIGLVFLLPLIYFAVRGRIERGLAPKLVTLFVLGGLQGALGWFMVKSGLVDVPHVSPYRLTAHLALAVAIYAYTLWIAFGLLQPRVDRAKIPDRTRRSGWILFGLISLTFLAGGFVAGNKAGFAYNTFPLMNGRFAPEGMWMLDPWWRNLFENVATVQFDHRLLAYALALAVPLYAWQSWRSVVSLQARRTIFLLLLTLALQITLGITTLLWIVPVPLAAAHQAGALILFTMMLYLNFCLRRR